MLVEVFFSHFQCSVFAGVWVRNEVTMSVTTSAPHAPDGLCVSFPWQGFFSEEENTFLRVADLTPCEFLGGWLEEKQEEQCGVGWQPQSCRLTGNSSGWPWNTWKGPTGAPGSLNLHSNPAAAGEHRLPEGFPPTD